MNRLPGSEFQILLALADGGRQGSEIRDEVALRTEGTVILGPGTLYTSIKRMLGGGLIREVNQPAQGTATRRVYQITRAGREAVRSEAELLARDLEHARMKQLAPGGAG